MAELEASRGPRSWLVDGLTRLFGDNKTAAEYANKVADLYDLTGAGAVTTGAYDAGNALAKAAQDPSKQKLMAAGLTAASMLPFSNALGKAAGMAAKDAGRTTHIFAGVQAKRADLPEMERSAEMLSRGIDPTEVWRDTGWTPNVANQATWEINDQPSKFFHPNPPPPKKSYDELLQMEGRGENIAPWINASKTTNHKLPDVLDHPELFENYPGLKNVEVRISQHPERTLGYGASWDATGGHSGRITMARDVASDPERAKSVILHELQHAVQDIEGFPRGSNPKYMGMLHSAQDPEIMANAQDINTDSPHAIAYELYRRAAGETEARNVQERMNMSQYARDTNIPFTTEDVPRYQQIILNGNYAPVANPSRNY